MFVITNISVRDIFFVLSICFLFYPYIIQLFLNKNTDGIENVLKVESGEGHINIVQLLLNSEAKSYEGVVGEAKKHCHAEIVGF